MARFLIDSNETTPQPNDMRHPTVPVIGLTLAGSPVRQGYPGLEVTYDLLSYEKMRALLALYDPIDPRVTVTFDEPQSGQSVRYDAVMLEPEIGRRATLFYLNVTVRFIRLTNRTVL